MSAKFYVIMEVGRYLSIRADIRVTYEIKPAIHLPLIGLAAQSLKNSFLAQKGTLALVFNCNKTSLFDLLRRNFCDAWHCCWC